MSDRTPQRVPANTLRGEWRARRDARRQLLAQVRARRRLVLMKRQRDIKQKGREEAW